MKPEIATELALRNWRDRKTKSLHSKQTPYPRYRDPTPESPEEAYGQKEFVETSSYYHE